MKILGLDPSLTNYGWCLINYEASPVVLGKGRFQTKPSTVFIERYIYMRECIDKLCADYQFDSVGIESPPFGMQWSEGLYGLFLFAIESLYRHKKNVYFWEPTTVKARAKEILGHPGKMFKSDMIDAAKLASGVKKWNNDEADAFNVAHLTARFLSFQSGALTTLTEKEEWIFRGEKAHRNGSVTQRGMIFREDDRFFLFGVSHGETQDSST
jgi:Holliday junction resolvasome RuvABC endonuclease subunit